MRAWRRMLTLAGGAVLAAGPLAGQCPDGSQPPCAGRPARVSPAPAAHSVAVLRFENLSRDTTDLYLAEGLTDETTMRLWLAGDTARAIAF